MKLLTKKIILLISIILIGLNGYAGTPAPSTPTQQSETLPPEKAPINKNLILLAMAGTLIGLYTIHKHKTKQKKTLN